MYYFMLVIYVGSRKPVTESNNVLDDISEVIKTRFNLVKILPWEKKKLKYSTIAFA